MTNRIRVILMGCLIWATMTWLFGISRWAPNPFAMGAIVWALNGLGLSFVIPNSQSVIADYYTADTRGRAFGLWMLNGSMGAMFGSLFATSVSGWNSHALRGWQLVMFTLSCLSGAIGWLNIHFARDPRDEEVRSSLQGTTEEEQKLIRGMKSDEGVSSSCRSWSDIRAAILAVFRIPTFRIIILQGIVGSMPWKALASFMTLYLQLIGMSDIQAAMVTSVFLLGTAGGFWIGGAVGDRASLLSPNHGRIVACQFSVVSGIPLMVLIFKGLPKNGDYSSAALYALVFFVTGILISWAAPACNSPIFAEIVHPSTRNIIYSLDRCLEDALASPVSFLTGLAAERIWGFEGEATSTEDVVMNLEKAEALSAALVWFTVVPWTLCFIFYCGLHFTYRKDRRHQNVDADA